MTQIIQKWVSLKYLLISGETEFCRIHGTQELVLVFTTIYKNTPYI